jgi:hypothetical protein
MRTTSLDETGGTMVHLVVRLSCEIAQKLIYPTFVTFSPLPYAYSNDKDNLTVQWGVQDHYEIVRKVGRGKYSEASIVYQREYRLASSSPR